MHRCLDAIEFPEDGRGGERLLRVLGKGWKRLTSAFNHREATEDLLDVGEMAEVYRASSLLVVVHVRCRCRSYLRRHRLLWMPPESSQQSKIITRLSKSTARKPP